MRKVKERRGISWKLSSSKRLVRVLKLLRRSPTTSVGLVVLAGVLMCVAFAPFLAPCDPIRQDLRNTLKPPAWIEGGDSRFLLGTDQLGRDILSRLIYGSRVSLAVAFLAVGVSMALGVPLGLIAGFYGGWIDTIISRLIDTQLAIPYVLLAVTVVLVVGPSLPAIVGVLALHGWAQYARVVRGQVLSLKEWEYILSARAIAASRGRILFRHLLPNVVNVLIVLGTLEMANMVLFEAGLSFLGLGIPPPAPSWGRTLSDGRNYLASAWWIAAFPGAAISITTLALNLVGDGIRTLLDPMARRRL